MGLAQLFTSFLYKHLTYFVWIKQEQSYRSASLREPGDPKP